MTHERSPSILKPIMAGTLAKNLQGMGQSRVLNCLLGKSRPNPAYARGWHLPRTLVIPRTAVIDWLID